MMIRHKNLRSGHNGSAKHDQLQWVDDKVQKYDKHDQDDHLILKPEVQ